MEVDYRKTQEFLSVRRKLKDDWGKKYKALQIKTQEIAEKELNYWDIEQQVNQLQKDEGQKNIFGNFQNKKLQNIFQLMKLFQKENLHIIDLGKTLTQQVLYEIPGLKKQIISIDSQIKTCYNRIDDYNQGIKNYKQMFEQQCQKHLIKGENIDEEVPKMIEQIPDLFEEINSLVHNNQTLFEATLYYRKFTQTYNNVQLDFIVPKLFEFIHTGNHLQADDDKDDFEIIQAPPKQDEIDWMKYIQPVQVKIQESRLMDTKLRNSLLSDLLELQYFLKARIQNLQNHSSNAILDAYDNKEELEISLQKLEEYDVFITLIINKFTNSKLRQLLILKDSQKTQQRLIENLKSFNQQITKFEYNIKSTESKIQDLEYEKDKAQKEIQQQLDNVKNIKQVLQNYMTDLFKTEITVIGDAILQ
ncbi:hypothetical protein pb186bvf_012536 [Paramecium bursaria]